MILTMVHVTLSPFGKLSMKKSLCASIPKIKEDAMRKLLPEHFRDTSGFDNIYSVGMENSTDFCQVQIILIMTADWQITRECHLLLVRRDLTMLELKSWFIFQTLIMVLSGLKSLIIHILLECKSIGQIRSLDRSFL